MLFIYNQLDTFKDIALSVLEVLKKNNLHAEIISEIPRQRVSQHVMLEIPSNSRKTDLYICFGFNDYQGPIPVNYIVYQLEQTAKGNDTTRHWFTENYIGLLKGALGVWDYSIKNIQNLKKYGINKVSYVPLIYMPILDTLHQRPDSDKSIDVLFYGSMNLRRKKIYNDLKQIGINVDFNWFNLWGDQLKEKIQNAKIVLNIHFYEDPILETSRLSYLVGNGAFVISERSIDPLLDKGYENLVVFTEYDRIVESCLQFLSIKKRTRSEFALKAYQTFKQTQYNIPLTLLQPYTSLNDNDGIASSDNEGKHNQNVPIVELKYLVAETEKTADGDEILKLPNIDFNALPNVSVVTLTYNRSEILAVAVRNFQRFIYPEDKIEWIIIDDSNPRHRELNQKIIGCEHQMRDPRIKYVPLEHRLSVSEKRNKAVQEASFDIIVHMDDDDYYPPESVLARVKLLIKYADQGIGCVGCRQIGVYNLMENYSYLMDCKFPSEASLAYTYNFWAENPFPNKDVPEGEGIPFLYQRTAQIAVMPYIFNLIAITHHKNITGKLRTLELDPDEKYTNFFSLWDFNTQLFFLDIKSAIKKEQKYIKVKS